MKVFMKLAAAALVLAGCQPTMDAASGGNQLATAADMSAIVGKRLVHSSEGLNPAQYVVFNADGTVGGVWDGATIVGTYVMRDGFFCRELTQGPRGPSPEDCQLLIQTGNQIQGSRDRGNGGSFTYTVM